MIHFDFGYLIFSFLIVKNFHFILINHLLIRLERLNLLEDCFF